MKRILSLLFIALVSCVGISAQNLYVGVEGKKTYGEDIFHYWEAGVFASYAHPIFLRLGFDAQAGLYTHYYPEGAATLYFLVTPDSAPPEIDMFASTFGGKLAANLTLKIASPISLYTGPSVRCNFFQKDYFRGGGNMDVEIHRANVQWNVGITGDIKRFRIRFSWEHDLTEQDEDGIKVNGFLLSLAYRL